MGTLSLDDYEDVRIWAPWGHMAGRWYGNRVDRPILAMHGWLDNLGTFDTLIPLLPDYLGVLCIDLCGHGSSSRLPPGQHYSADDWMLAIGRVMKEYKWQKVSLMGHSLGGVLSFIHASLAPHTVDMVIALDIILPPLDAPINIDIMAHFMEKHLVEEARVESFLTGAEPPSYTIGQLRKLISKGSNDSVPPELAHHLIYRSVAKSKIYPDKFYFTRDGRTKFYSLYPLNAELAAEMARRIKDIPYLVIKGTESSFIRPYCDEVISIMRSQNQHFELHEVRGAHHVHLINPKGCAQHIVPFLRRHRPQPVGSWALDGEDGGALSKRGQREALESFFVRSQKRQNKL